MKNNINNKIAGKNISEWIKLYPLIENIIKTQTVWWNNPELLSFKKAIQKVSITKTDIDDANKRLLRFAPYFTATFPQTKKYNGIIESPIRFIDSMQKYLQQNQPEPICGRILLKCDNELPISGSVKSRGGVYEVLKYAETIALKNKLLKLTDDYSIFNSEKFKKLFSKYTITAGSTGNLGLSIGIISAKLGFKVYIHMSSEAKEWKKEMLKSCGVNVIEHQSSYSQAVKESRKQAENNDKTYFIDDENSVDLFLGYAVAAKRLEDQLKQLKITVDKEHPLFVYLPCGIGGAPGGITLGLKYIFADNVHCFFGEPTHSPSMLLGLITKQYDKISVKDFGIDNITAADGLACDTTSKFIGKTLKNLISGIYTVEDKELYLLLKHIIDIEYINLEPSALAGVAGIKNLFNSDEGKNYIKQHGLENYMKNSTHIAWATGGSMVPENIMKEYYDKGV